MKPSVLLGFGLWMSLCSSIAFAQESQEQVVLKQGKKYLNINLTALERYQRRLDRKQEQLLKQLAKQEKKLSRKLQKKDSVAWAAYKQRGISFDSLSRVAPHDRLISSNAIRSKSNAVIDSLKGVTAFMQSLSEKAEQGSGSNELTNYSERLKAIDDHLKYREILNDKLNKQAALLRSGFGNNTAALKGFERKLYYGQAQIKAYKAMANDPGKLERKAYEFLQEQAGFEESVDGAVSGAALAGKGGGNLSAADLERMGYQTKRMVNASLQQKFATASSGVQQQIAGEINSWQKEKLEPVTKALADVKDLGARAKDAKTGVRSLQGIKDDLAKPVKVNPMRSRPFWQRFEKSYDFQVTRALESGTPAILQLGGMLAYRQSPSFRTGAGIAGNIGLGESWSQIKFSFEGLGIRTFASWEVKFGIAAYAGYERMYKHVAFYAASTSDAVIASTTHNTSTYNERALLGLAKSYRINSKHNGAIQVLYDFWWREKGLSTPIIIRVSNY